MKILTISYHNEAISEIAYKQLNNTCSGTPVYLLDNNYPLTKDKDHVRNICDKYGFKYFNAGENLGLHEGYNYLAKQCDDEIIILYDGDSYPITNEWDKALENVHLRPDIVWASLYNQHSYKEMDERGYDQVEINGYNCRITKRPVINSISAFKRSWLEEVSWFTEPSKYYGGLEMAMWYKKKPEYKWAFLDDYKETALPNVGEIQDLIYTEYKIAHAHKGDPRSFEEYASERST